jgi:hypothetical protein
MIVPHGQSIALKRRRSQTGLFPAGGARFRPSIRGPQWATLGVMATRLQNNQWWLRSVNGKPAVIFFIEKTDVDNVGATWVTYTCYMEGKEPQRSRRKESELAVIHTSKGTRHVPDPAEISALLLQWGCFGC